jgi:predicted DNA-binding transcriptional regulator AlpA
MRASKVISNQHDPAAVLLERQIKNALVDLLGLQGGAFDDAIARLAGDALIGANQVVSLAGISAANIYRRIKDPEDPFPRPIRVDSRSLWLLSEVREWIRSRVAAHRGQTLAA